MRHDWSRTFALPVSLLGPRFFDSVRSFNLIAIKHNSREHFSQFQAQALPLPQIELKVRVQAVQRKLRRWLVGS